MFLLPGLLLAAQEERWLRGQVVTLDAHDQSVPEANITVSIKEISGSSGVTNLQGIFRLSLPDYYEVGDEVTLQIDKPGWAIQYPLDGKVRIPVNTRKKMVDVRLLPRGSKLFWSDDRIEKFITDVAEKSKQQVTPAQEERGDIDFSRYIKDWAIQYGFNAPSIFRSLRLAMAGIRKAQA